jgi:gliding motility-associated-like protein
MKNNSNNTVLKRSIVITVLLLIFSFNYIEKSYSQAQCASASPLTIGANDVTCNSQAWGTLGVDFDDNTPTAITTITNSCGVAASYNANWYSFTGDGTKIRVKIFNQDGASNFLVFENQACGATMIVSQCASFPDDNLPHVLDINTINGATYKIAVTHDGSAGMIGSICAFKTNGLPYSSICDATPVILTVNTKDVNCFSNYQTANTNHPPTAPATPCASPTLDEWWIGTFTATSTKTEIFLYGKDETGGSIEVLEGPCSGSMVDVFCLANFGSDKNQPNWGTMTTVPGKQYYVIIRSSSSGLVGRVCVYNQSVEPTKPACAAGMSFEDGAGAGWVGAYGGWRLAWTPACNQFVWDLPFTPANFNNTRFMITTGPGRDPKIEMVPIVAPGGGNYSFRMGAPGAGLSTIGQTEGYSYQVPGDYKVRNHAAAEKMEYCFTVDPNNAGFGYKYSCLMDNPMHNAVQQPYFQVYMYAKATGDTIPCGQYQHWPGDGKSPFYYVGKNSDVIINEGNCFTPWTDVLTDLSGYAGQQVCVILRQKDCSGNYTVPNNPPWDSAEAGSHGVYTYFDTYCIPMKIEYPEFCATTSSIQMCAPAGYISYSWANGPGLVPPLNQRCVTVNNPVSGTTYTVTMISFSGCPVIKKVKINGIPMITSLDTMLCPGEGPITISAVVTDPTKDPPYTYTWSTGSNSTAIIVNPSATTSYTVTVTNGSGCTGTQQIVVGRKTCAPAVLVNNATVCLGVCATLNATGSGGTIPYTYSWSPSAGLSGTTGATVTACPSVTTTYTVTIRDNPGVTATARSVVTVNPLPNITATGGTICIGASINISASGGVVYSWSTGQFTNPLNVTPNVTTTYTVTGINVNGCTNTNSCVVVVNPLPTITANGGTVCNGSSTLITAGGGLTYTWSNGVQGSSQNVTPSINTTYYVTSTDVNGCTGSAFCVVVVNNNITPVVNNPTICAGACVTLIVSGGDNYTWTPGGQTGPSITVCPVTTTTYFVSATNVFGCTGTVIATVTVNPLPNITATGGTICLNASINISANGGTTYTWNTGSNSNPYNVTPNVTTTYTVTGTDNNTCTNTALCVVVVNPLPTVTATGGTICVNATQVITATGANTYVWSNGFNGASQTVTPTVTTTYYVTGTDVNLCTGTAFCVVIVNTSLTISTTGAEICNGFSAIVSASGAGIGGTYAWNIGTGQSQNVTPVTTTTYYVTGTDVLGCTGTGYAVVVVNQLPSVSVLGKTICYGTSTTLTANPSGGSGTYLSYVWTPGPLNGKTVNVTPLVNTTYYVTLTDSKGCTATTTVSVIVSPQMFASITKIDATCGLPNASATVAGTGGIPFTTGAPYTYLWSPGSYATDIISNVLSGPYSVTLTDAVGCTVTATTTILDTPPVTLSTSQTPTNCFPTGTACANVLTGTPPYTYIWSTVPPQNTQCATNIDSGPCTVTVVDSKGCSAIANVVVLVNNPLSITTTTTPEHCDQMDGTATANPAGGNPALGPYTYLWDNGGTTKTIIDLAQGSYCVTVLYGSCIISKCATVLEKLGPKADFTYTPAVLDIFENTTALFDDLSTPGGQPIVQWHWDFDDDNSTADIRLPIHTYKAVGTYTVCLKVTDSENCVDSICKPIIVRDIFTVYIPNAFSPNKDLLNEGFIPQGYRIDPNNFTMMIFNRWGEEIYKTNDLSKSWNGRFQNTGDVVQVGVYVYRVIVKELEGPKHEFIGRVSVIR